MTSNWKTMRNTLVWLIVAVITMGIVISSPYIMKSSAASLPTVKSCKGLTVKQSGKSWVTVDAKGTRVSYTGVAQNNLGWWRVENGVVNFKATGVYQNDYGWWRVETGKVNFNANQIYQNGYGWWKTTNGKVTFDENGVFQNSLGWWKVKDSKVDFSFTGIASNSNGTWYLKEGKVRFDANFDTDATPVHPYRYDGDWYDVKNGAATKVDWKPIVVEVVKETEKEYPISRALLIQVLQAEDIGFTESEATYGADNADIDYVEVAKNCAVEYLVDEDLNDTGISKAFLEEALKDYELFTAAETKAAVDWVEAGQKDADAFWKKHATVAAQDLYDAVKEDKKTVTDADLKEIKSVLVEDLLFTEAQATYGIEHITK